MPRANAAEQALSLQVSTPAAAVQAGQTILLRATAARAGHPIAGQEVWAYLNGKRWGASAVTDARGQAKFLLALPHPGTTQIQVIPGQYPQGQRPLPASWIWSDKVFDKQTVYFTKAFTEPKSTRNATLYIACDDQFEAFLNGHLIANGTSWKVVQVVQNVDRWLKAGTNLLAVRGYNGGGPAGLLAALTLTTPTGTQTISSDASWHTDANRPAGWPVLGENAAANAGVQAEIGGGAWGNGLEDWPGLSGVFYPVGKPLPYNTPRSNTLTLRVAPRRVTVTRDPNHLVGMDWEPWFTRDGGARWDTAEAVPVLGNYTSADADVTRQHILWMADMGIDFLVSDWSNNLGGVQSWDTYPIAANGMIQNTTKLLDVLAQMRSEGLPTPQVTLLLGIGAPAALKGELQYVEDTYIKNPRYQGLWVQHEGKPLIEILSAQLQGVINTWPAIDPHGYFTVRWEWIDLARKPQGRPGWWSWMEAIIDPTVTRRNGLPEAMTITPAFFGDGGWLAPDAYARRNGATYIHEFQDALTTKPKVLQINQWNEFLASAKGQGGGPKHDIYFDVYDVPRSDDIEPTTPFASGYRGQNGWGFQYLNLTRAMICLYHAKAPDSTLLAVASPSAGQRVSGSTLHMEWSTAGKPVKSYTLFLDGRMVASGLHAEAFDIPVGNLAAGSHVLTLKANGAVTRFPISRTQVDQNLARPRPVAVSTEFFKAASL